MVSTSPKDRVVGPLPNDMAFFWLVNRGYTTHLRYLDDPPRTPYRVAEWD